MLITNPDLEFSSTTIRVLISYMGASRSRRLWPSLRAIARTDDQDVGEFANWHDRFHRITDQESRCVVDRGSGEKDNGQYDNADEVFGERACVFVSRFGLAAVKVGAEYFDEDFRVSRRR